MKKYVTGGLDFPTTLNHPEPHDPHRFFNRMILWQTPSPPDFRIDHQSAKKLYEIEKFPQPKVRCKGPSFDFLLD